MIARHSARPARGHLAAVQRLTNGSGIGSSDVYSHTVFTVVYSSAAAVPPSQPWPDRPCLPKGARGEVVSLGVV